MEEELHHLKASCHCGNFNILVPVRKSSLPLPASSCHCNRCRHSSGSLCNTYLMLHDQSFTPEASVTCRLKQYKSTEEITRYFCPNCGCHVLWNGPDEDSWNIPTGCLDRIEGFVTFRDHVFVEDTLDGGCSDWMISSFGTRYATFTDELPIGWRAASDRVSNSPSDRLHAHCDCNGISIYIARPSAASEQASSPLPDLLLPRNIGFGEVHNTSELWWLRCDKTKFLGGICACNTCRLVNGFEFIHWAFIPTSDISLDKDGTMPFSTDFGTLKAYRSSKNVCRRFCSNCGATVFWDGDERGGLIDVAAGLLDAPEGARAENWLEWATDRVSYREDAEVRTGTLITAIEKDLGAWGKAVQSKQKPH